MSGPRKLSTSLFSVFLSSALVAAPVAAQEDFALPEGDFELPEGDFESFDAEPDEDSSSSTKPDEENEPAPAKKPRAEKPATAEPEPAPAMQPEMDAQEEGTLDSSDDDENAAPEENSSASAPRAPRAPLDRAPLTSTETVELVTEQPPESEGDGAMFLITTGIGTALGLAVLAGLGVGGAVLFSTELGPKGSVTVTPR